MFAALGLTDEATERDVVAARRRLAKELHPDAGGSVEQMQRLNELVTAALAAIASGSAAGRTPSPGRRPPRPAPGPVRRDHPSFTIEALPAEAFEALLIVGSWLGDVVDDEPPYALEIALAEVPGTWCRLDLVPDAGASTVSIAVGGSSRPPAVDDVRDAFVEGLNRLDWSELGT